MFLGIQAHHTADGIFLQQSHYANAILESAGFSSCKPAATPISPKTGNQPSTDPPYPDPTFYRRLAGSLQYLTITRPDIAFATNCICQHMHNPSLHHFQLLKRLLRYIKGTIHFGLPICKGDLTLRSYADADWAADSTDRKSVTGFCTFLGPNLISWHVKKQVTVAKSSTEAEYRALSSATSDVIVTTRAS
ncbi:uncharacterized protein LOC110112404, partial [Dendrobium catenatum]|uniref:uncharacterized protein LOC110112404 n=1 Tax=Dendrobium catenatum TaxID=906689 RepID=UPI0009F5C99F